MSLCCMLGSYRAPSSLQPVWVEEAALCSACGGPFSFFFHQFETVPLRYVLFLIFLLLDSFFTVSYLAFNSRWFLLVPRWSSCFP